MLRVFLASRGNLREVEKHLGVSYPTARLRFADLLRKLDLTDEPEPQPRLTRDQILAEVASGALKPAEAAELLRTLSTAQTTRSVASPTGRFPTQRGKPALDMGCNLCSASGSHAAWESCDGRGDWARPKRPRLRRAGAATVPRRWCLRPATGG